MTEKVVRLRALLVVLATAVLCIVLHEAGHALAGWATGGRIAELDVLSVRPHVRRIGPATPIVNAVRATAGSALILIAWFFAMALMPARRGTRVMQTISCFAAMEMAGWFLSAVMHPWQPQRNDAGAFLNLSGSHPLLIVLTCSVIMWAAWVALQARARVDSRQLFPAL